MQSDEHKAKLEGDSAMKDIGCNQDLEMSPANIARAKEFDGRYHYRRANKCIRCATAKSTDKDCFFALDFKVVRNALDKCTNCRRSGYKCEAIDDSLAHGSTTAGLSKAHDLDEKKTPSPAAAMPSTSTLATPTVTPPASPALTPAPALLPLRKLKLPSFMMHTPLNTKENGKRKAVSDLWDSGPCVRHRDGLACPVRHRTSLINPLKYSRIQDSSSEPSATRKPHADIVSNDHPIDKATMLRQISRLNISFESFTDVSLRQVESDQKHREQEVAVEERKLAYEESKRLCEERKRAYKESKQAYEESIRVSEEKKRVFKENERLCEESEPAYTATQEWLVAKSESAGEDLIKEATNLLSSIKQITPLRNIVPALRHFRSVFTEFQRVQGKLSEAHKFKGDRAQILYALMKSIHKVIDRVIPVEDPGEGLSGYHEE